MKAIPTDPAARPLRPPWYQRPVVLLNWLALALTIGLFATFLVQAGLLDMFTAKITVAPPEDLTLEKVVVRSSSVNGFDREEQPYTIDSVTAAQDPDKPNLIVLSGITGKLRKASGQEVTIASQNGVYDSDGKILDLEGEVRIVSKGRFAAKMPRARITLDNKQLFTEDHVVVTLKSGDITARGLKILDDGKNITFLSRVRAKLRYAAEKESKQE